MFLLEKETIVFEFHWKKCLCIEIKARYSIKDATADENVFGTFVEYYKGKQDIILGYANISTILNFYVYPNMEQKKRRIDRMFTSLGTNEKKPQPRFSLVGAFCVPEAGLEPARL